ncbi:MAG: AraC family transcriptional regulator, partial [Cyclobacteriaceae bacterium]
MVEQELEKLGIEPAVVEPGTVRLLTDITPDQIELLKVNLLKIGLELLDDRKSILIEKIKNVVIELVHHSDKLPKVNYSDYISRKLDLDY